MPQMTTQDLLHTLDAIAHWYALARAETEMRDYDAKQGHDPSSYNARIRSYEETARAMRLGLETGETWCSCHLRPSSEWQQADHFQGGRIQR